MTSPTYGIIFNPDDTDPRPAQPSDLSVVGLCLPADDADEDFLPLNEPVAFDSGDPAALAKLGDTELAHAVAAIDNQLADLQSSARVVAVRVEKGANAAATIANIVGSITDTSEGGHVGTGIHAFLRAGTMLGVIPRLIGAPGFTGQTTQDGDNTEANPICAELPGVCSKILAHAVVAGPATDQQAATNWRETLASRRLIPVDGGVKVAAGVGSRYDDGAAQVLGLGVRTDFLHGGFPFWSFANQQVQGILGLQKYYPFSLTDGATAAQELLAAHIGIFSRGEIGVETAAAESGFVFAGTFNADTDPNWWFYNKSRARDWMHLAILKSIRLRLGRENVTPHSVQAVMNDVVEINAEAMRQGGSIGFKVGFEAAANSALNLRQGKFRIFFAAENPAPIMQVTVDSRPYLAALEVELATLVAQAATLVPQYVAA